jgi:urease accessory protein
MSAHAVTAILDAPNLDATSWLVWQLADSAFPAGGFAHSGGLEAVAQNGEIKSAADLENFLHTALQQTAHGSLPFVGAGFNALVPFAEVDWLFDAFTPNHVANRASRAQGQAWLASAERSFGSPAIAEIRETVLRDALPGHFAPVFGTVARVLGVECAVALRLFVFLQLRGWTSSAVRLGIIGPLQAQAIQHRLSAHAESAAELGREFSLNDAAQTAPLLDLLHATHDRLYSRLFQS